jgi:hypothetical protein
MISLLVAKKKGGIFFFEPFPTGFLRVISFDLLFCRPPSTPVPVVSVAYAKQLRAASAMVHNGVKKEFRGRKEGKGEKKGVGGCRRGGGSSLTAVCYSVPTLKSFSPLTPSFSLLISCISYIQRARPSSSTNFFFPF